MLPHLNDNHLVLTDNDSNMDHSPRRLPKYDLSDNIRKVVESKKTISKRIVKDLLKYQKRKNLIVSEPEIGIKV